MEFELFDAERKKNKCPMILAFAIKVIVSSKNYGELTNFVGRKIKISLY